MTGQNREYLFRLRGDAQQLQQAAEAAAQGVDRLAGSTEALARDQQAAQRAGEAFIGNLARQAAAVGKSQSELLALRAAELGVADAARPLIQQLAAATAAHEAETAAVQRAAAAQRALENIRAAAQAQQRGQYQAQQQFIDGLQREAAAVGKTRSELLAMQAAKLGVTAQAAPLIQRLQAGERAFGGFARGGKLSAQELTQVGFQLNDLAVQVASGGNPIIALVQQGSQLSGTFGGIGNAARALTSLITPVGVALGGLAAAVGVLTFGYATGYREQAAFERGLLLTGNRAGVTKGQLDEYSRAIEDATRVTIGAAREATQAVAASGAFGPGAVEEVSRAVAILADRTGRSADDVVKDFARMRDGVARWAADSNRSYNFLTAEQFKYIQRLEQQGKAEEAARETARLLADQLGQKTPTELGLLDRALVATTKLWSDFWDAAFDIGRPITIEQQLKNAEAALAVLEQGLGTSPEEGGGASSAAEQAQRAVVEALRARVRAAQDAAKAQAAAAADAQDEITANSKAVLDARLDLQRAAAQRGQALADLARDRELAANERAFEREEISYAGYLARRAALEKQAINARLAAVDAEIALEKQRTIENPRREAGRAAEIQQQAKLIELETRRAAIRKDFIRLEADVARQFGREDTSPAGRAALELAEVEEQEARARNQRRDAAIAAQGELFDATEAINRSLIRDDRERGLAQIEAERQQLVQRLDLYVLNADERRAAEEGLADYIVARQRQLTEELKPEWQRLQEAWADTQANMQRASDQFQTDFLLGGRETFRQFVREGELSFDRLGDLLLDTLADQVFEQNIAPLFGQIGNAIARTVGLGGGTPAAAAGAAGGAAAQAAATAQATALTAATAATTAQTTATASLSAATSSQALQAGQASVSLLGLAQAAQLAATQLLSVTAGGGGGSSLLGSVASAFAGFFTGTPAVASAVYSPALPVGTPLPSLGGRRTGGPTRAGGYYEVAEDDEPELYRVGRRTYLLNPGQGQVTPAQPLRAPAGAGAAAAPAAPIVNVRLIEGARTPSVEQQPTANGVDIEIRIARIAEDAVARSVADGGKVGRAMQSTFGLQRQGALRR